MAEPGFVSPSAPSHSTSPTDRKRNTPAPLRPEALQAHGNVFSLDAQGCVLLSPPPPPANGGSSFAAQSTGPQENHSRTDESLIRSDFETDTTNWLWSPAKQSNRSNSDAASDLLQGLQIRTDLPLPRTSRPSYSVESDRSLRQSMSYSNLPRKTPSIRATLHSSAGSISPGSVISSPQIAAMLDITPLPSPTLAGHDIWGALMRTSSRGSSTASKSDIPAYLSSSMTLSPKTATLSPTSPTRRKVYPGLRPTSEVDGSGDIRAKNEANDSRTRSVSDYVPDILAIHKPRNIAVSSAGPLAVLTPSQANLHREEYLAESRGLATPTAYEPSQTRPLEEEEEEEENDVKPPPAKRARIEVYNAKSTVGNHPRRYASIRLLGQGSFSKVYLAVKQTDTEDEALKHVHGSNELKAIKSRSRRLVAVKVVEHGPAGGADAERIEVSLKREVEIMKAVKHPSIVHLKAFGNSDTAQTLLIMNYCPGGDLFELASTKMDLLVPSLLQRIFAELISAVQYLHHHLIVHRDIKLENVLVNLPAQLYHDIDNWQTLDRPVVTLTDLGLSRRIPEPPESALLTTRCGSEDYAAPELLMGQPYDGRQTDAWALGVLLYALMEGRLPFDPLPGARGDPALLRARTPHRIARIEWAWYKYGDEDGEWNEEKGRDLMGGRKAVEGLLQRQRMRFGLDKVQAMGWIKSGIQVEGGLRWNEEDQR